MNDSIETSAVRNQHVKSVMTTKSGEERTFWKRFCKIFWLLVFVAILLSAFEFVQFINSSKYPRGRKVLESAQKEFLRANASEFVPTITFEKSYLRQVKRQTHLRNYCSKDLQLKSYFAERSKNLIYSDRAHVIYCSVPKVACTNWKRMMQYFDGRVNDPLQISSKEDVHKLQYRLLRYLPTEVARRKKQSFYSFLFVRHPLERLVSAFRNKFQSPYNRVFQKRYGSQILRAYRKGLTREEYAKGENVQFDEFIKFIIDEYDEHGVDNFNEHWQVVNRLCHPCEMKYNYIGKFETLLEDADSVLKEIDVDQQVRFPANAKDKYKVNVSNIMAEKYQDITASNIRKLYKIYEADFLAFNYEIPGYLLDKPS